MTITYSKDDRSPEFIRHCWLKQEYIPHKRFLRLARSTATSQWTANMANAGLFALERWVHDLNDMTAGELATWAEGMRNRDT